MPAEYDLLKPYPYAREICRKCGGPFPEFLRGIVQSRSRKLFGFPYCAIICHHCKEVIGWEEPNNFNVSIFNKAIKWLIDYLCRLIEKHCYSGM